MKTLLLLTGKTTDSHVQALIDDYSERIMRYMSFSVGVVNEPRGMANMSQQQVKDREGDAIMKHIEPGDYVVLLDEKGIEMSSREMASWLQKRQMAGRRIVFVIGGPYGFSSQIYSRADAKLSLSRLTFPHQLVRVIFTEQLYRACTILKGEPYHHD